MKIIKGYTELGKANVSMFIKSRVKTEGLSISHDEHLDMLLSDFGETLESCDEHEFKSSETKSGNPELFYLDEDFFTWGEL